jgi:UDPglucose 6-dehydrogenase
MRLSIFGSGYVGLVTAACLTQQGHTVVCIDCDAARVAALDAGQVPFYEPQLRGLLLANQRAGRLLFASDSLTESRASSVHMVAVGTPSQADGGADLTAVEAVVDDIAASMQGYTVVLIKSTVPVGTAQRLRQRIAAQLAARNHTATFDVVSNPEFLKEGEAVADCLAPERIVLGCDPSATLDRCRQVIETLYADYTADHVPLLWMDTFSAELTKYAANAMLATKISLVNEIAGACDALGADIQQVRRGLATDRRIGPHFMAPGIGYGGSCFSKDLHALMHAGHIANIALPVLAAVQQANEDLRTRFFERVATHFHGNLVGKQIAVWGLAFKPGTDDVRDAPALCIVRRLHAAGAHVTCYDPVATANARRALADLARVRFVSDALDAVDAAAALCILTEWPEFFAVDLQHVARLMQNTVIFDGRHVVTPEKLADLEPVTYVALGRPSLSHEDDMQAFPAAHAAQAHAT